MKKTIKNLLKALSLIALVSVLLVSCGGADKEQDSGNSNGGSDTILIGGMGPLTGEAASYGTSVKQGAEIAVKEINDAGGVEVGDKTYQLKLKFEDDMAGEDTAVTAFNSLMDSKIDVFLGGVTSGSSMAIIDLAQRENILLLSPSGSELGITKYDNAFRLCFTDPFQGETMADFFIDKLKMKKVAIIYNNSDTYSTGVMEAFVESVEAKGGTVVAKESFNKGDVDFTTQLTSIKDKNPDAIFVPAYYQDASYITTQASELGMDIPFLGSDGWDGVLDQLPNKDVAEGAIFLSPFLATDDAIATKSFVEKYETAYKATPDQFAADGYDSIYVFAAAFEEAGSLDSDALISAMTKIEVAGLTGDMTFTADGEPNKGSKFVEIKDGEYTLR